MCLQAKTELVALYIYTIYLCKYIKNLRFFPFFPQANYSHWVAFPSVTKVAARYYDQPGEAMDRIPTLSYGLGVPCCVLATYVVERFGLRAGLHVGGSLTGIGERKMHI